MQLFQKKDANFLGSLKTKWENKRKNIENEQNNKKTEAGDNTEVVIENGDKDSHGFEK